MSEEPPRPVERAHPDIPERGLAWAAALGLGILAGVAAVVVHSLALEGDNLRPFFSICAEVSIGVLIAVTVEERRDDVSLRDATLQGMGLLNILLGLISALVGMLVTPEEEGPVAACFGFTWGGLIGGFASLLFIVGTESP